MIAVDQTDDSVVLSGSLFVELVSPYRFDGEYVLIRRIRF